MTKYFFVLLGCLSSVNVIAQTPEEPQPAFISVNINNAPVAENVLVLTQENKAGMTTLFIAETEIKSWRLNVENVKPIEQDGVRYFSLSHIAGLIYQLDPATQRLAITAEPRAFQQFDTRVERTEAPSAVRGGVGGFISYDIFAQSALDNKSIAGTLDGGVFNSYGVFTSGFLLAHSVDHALKSNVRQRLDSTFTHDDPLERTTLLIGDNITRAPAWSRSARIGGVQWGTNFATQPTLRTYPLQIASGQVAFPSIVDVFVNNVLTGRQEIPAGPFTLRDLPIVNGAGDIRVVTHDGVGRDQVFTQSFYGSTSLLSAGLNDYSLSAGTLRKNFGIDSNHYGSAIANGLWRHGMSERFTSEIAGEISRRTQAFGAGSIWLNPSIGELSGSIAHSWTNDNVNTKLSGFAYALNWLRQSKDLSFSASTRLATDGFRVASIAPGEILPRRETNIASSYGQRWGSMGISYIAQWRPGSERVDLATMSFTRNIGQRGFVGVTLLKSLRGPATKTLFVNYVLPLDASAFFGVSTQQSRENNLRNTESRLSYQQSLPSGNGYGYQLNASDLGNINADIRYQHRAGQALISYSRQNKLAGFRAGISGSLTLIGGELVWGRTIEDGFGLVEVPGYANVQIYLDNQPLGKTNQNGNYFVSRLRPYQINRVSIEQSDLPLDAEISTLKLDVTPFMKSGVVVIFPVHQSHGALLRLIDSNQRTLPVGAVATLQATGRRFPVVEDGEAYITDLIAQNSLRVDYESRSCTINFDFKSSDDPQPHLGNFICNLEK